MKTYTVAIDIRKVYHVEIEAESEDQARTLAENMQTTQIYEEGSLQDVETSVVECEEIVA